MAKVNNDETSVDEDQQKEVVAMEGSHIGSSSEKRKRSKNYVDGENGNEEKKLRSEFKVFIHNLNFDSSAEDIKKELSVIGKVVDLHLPMNKRRNKGYGFVQFEDEETKCYALQNNDKISIDGRSISIRELQPKTSDHQMKTYTSKMANLQYENTVFVVKINPTTLEEDILTHFKQFGEISKINVPRYPTGFSKTGNRGYAFISYNDAAGMNAALSTTEHEINNTYVVVNKATDRSKPQHEEKPDNELFINNISKLTDRNSLEDHFAKYGKITKVTLPIDRETRHHKGFGFVAFENMSGVTAALAEDHEIDDSLLLIKSAKDKDDTTTEPAKAKIPKPQFDNEIYVQGIDHTTKKQSIAKHFGQYGTIENINFPWNRRTSTNIGFAFIAYKTADSMKVALAKDHTIDGSTLNLTIKKKNDDKTETSTDDKVQEHTGEGEKVKDEGAAEEGGEDVEEGEGADEEGGEDVEEGEGAEE